MTIMRIRKRVQVLIAMVAVPVAWSAGCGTTSDQKRITRRQENLRHTVTIFEERESACAERLDHLSATLARRHARDVAQADKVPVELDRALQQEWRRWEQSQPTHERRIREKLLGNVGNIEQTLPKMLF